MGCGASSAAGASSGGTSLSPRRRGIRLRSGGDGLRPTSGSLTQNGIPSLLPEPFPQAVDPSRTTSSLAEACASGNLERVRAELQFLNGSRKDNHQSRASKSRLSSVLTALDRHTGYTLLFSAVINGHADVAEELLAAGADANPVCSGLEAMDANGEDQGDWVPLHAAVMAGAGDRGADEAGPRTDERLVTMLLAAGAVANAQDIRGNTPLHIAALNGGSVEAAAALLAGGGDPNTQNHKGRTPVHFAAAQGSHPMLQLLLDNPHLCGDVDVVDMDSNTPLHFAMAAGDHQVVRLLLAAGSAPDQFNIGGVTPRGVAEAGRRREMSAVFDEEFSESTESSGSGR